MKTVKYVLGRLFVITLKKMNYVNLPLFAWWNKIYSRDPWITSAKTDKNLLKGKIASIRKSQNSRDHWITSAKTDKHLLKGKIASIWKSENSLAYSLQDYTVYSVPGGDSTGEIIQSDGVSDYGCRLDRIGTCQCLATRRGNKCCRSHGDVLQVGISISGLGQKTDNSKVQS